MFDLFFDWFFSDKPIVLKKEHGTIIYNKNGFIYDIYVHPDHRLKGIGRSLVEEAEKNISTELIWGYCSYDSSSDANKFWKRLGYDSILNKISKKITMN